MRQIVLDTETTGLDPNQGHRIIELAGLEVVNRRATGRTVHYHLDPEREIDFGATEVHGKTWEDLRGKPKFRDIAGFRWLLLQVEIMAGYGQFDAQKFCGQRGLAW